MNQKTHRVASEADGSGRWSERVERLRGGEVERERTATCTCGLVWLREPEIGKTRIGVEEHLAASV